MEIIKLNLIPNGVNPTCHCSQYDEGRVIRIELFDGLTPYTLQSGDTVTLNVRKPDNTIVTTTVETTQGNNYVDIVTTEQICACVGYNLCDLTITNGSVVIGTLNFIMAIERDVLADGIPSQSVIEDLDELVQEAVGNNYYTKDETEELIDNEIKDVYPLGEASGAIASFNAGVIMPLKSLTAEIKATETGSGEKSPNNPYTISGFSQANIGAISDATNITFFKGVLEGTYGFVDLGSLNWKKGTSVFYTQNNLPTKLNASGVIPNILCIPYTATTYSKITTTDKSISIDINNGAVLINDSSYTTETNLKNSLNGVYLIYELATPTTPTITPEQFSSLCNSFGIIGNTYTFTFGQTVYGGHFNDKGELTINGNRFKLVDNNKIALQGSSNNNNVWRILGATSNVLSNNKQLCNIATYDLNAWQPNDSKANTFVIGEEGNLYLQLPKSVANTLSDFIAYITNNDVFFYHEMATPTVVQFTPTEVIKTLLGENNIFTNTNGNVDVIYHHALTAKNIYFDNTGTALQADNVEDAIKEILTLIQGGNNSRALNLSKGSLKVEAPVSNEEPAIEEDLTTEEETATEEEPEAISDSESEPTSDEER